MADFIVKENIEKSLWNKYVESSRQGTIFLNHDFVETLNVNYKTLLFCKGDEPAAGCMVLMDKDQKPLSSPYPFVPYQGFFFIENAESSVNKCVSRQFDLTEFIINYLVSQYGTVSQTHFRVNDLRAFLWHNYHAPEKRIFTLTLNYTPILDLSKYGSLDEYLSSVRSVRRQEYNKTISAGIRIVDSIDIDQLVKLHKLTFERQGLEYDPKEEQAVRSISSKALEKGFGRLQIAMIGDTPASAIFFLFDKQRGYYMFGANDPEHRKSFASTLLLINNIWKCKVDGLKEVDFVGCNSPQRGDYKLSFDGELLPYYQTELKVLG